VTTEVANETFPVPSGSNILDTYGNVIRGKINEEIVRSEFTIKLNLIELFSFIFSPWF
jgi:hypothetical protein